MALSNVKRDFEGDVKSEEVTEEVETVSAPAPEVKADPVAKSGVEATKAIAKASGSSLAKSILNTKTMIQEVQNAFPVEALQSMTPGSFKRINVNLGGISIDKTVKLGNWIKVQVLSWNYVWLATPKDDGDTAASFVRYSYDGETIPGETMTLKEYVEHLQEVENYPDARIQKRAEMYVNLIASEKEADGIDDSELLQVSLAPQSLGQLEKFLLECRVAKIQGKFTDEDDLGIVYLRKAEKTIKTNEFGLFTISRK